MAGGKELVDLEAEIAKVGKGKAAGLQARVDKPGGKVQIVDGISYS